MRRNHESARTSSACLVGVLIVGSLLPACGRDEDAAAMRRAERRPERIIVLAPSLTETVFALGLGDRVVGVSDYSKWPPEVANKPHLGGLVDPHLEQIATLHADLAILLPSQSELAHQLEGLGVATLTVRNETIEDVLESIHTIAVRCQVPVAGARLELRLRHALAPDPLPASPNVLLVVGRQAGSLRDLTAAGPNTFFDELLRRLGVRNAAADSPTRYPRLGLDAIVSAAPEVIIELQGHHLWEVNRADLIRDWRPLHAIPAVREGCVQVVAGDWALLPGPRLPPLYAAMRQAIVSCTGTG
jgi:iron complex transport system substrate-binding protein